jgi:cell division transport system permease protein
MTSIGYAFQEALVTLRRAGRSAAMSIGTIAVAFLTLGGFLLVSANLQSVVQRWASAAELSVYLRDDVDASARDALIGELNSHAAVESVEFVAREDAVERFKKDFPELADVATTTENPFPASLEVRLRTDAAATGAADAIASTLIERAEVADVRYDRQWLSRLVAVVSGVRIAGLVIAGVLVLGAAFTVSAVVRLSLEARREELDIMQLVGAPYAFIRGPSVAEGTLLGGIGALLSLVALWGLFVSTRGQLNSALQSWGSVGELRFLSPFEAAVLIGAGVVVGAVSGFIASRTVR